MNTDNHIYVIFGASGDLTKRQLCPAIYSLFVQKLLPERFAIVGVSRTNLSDDKFREVIRLAIAECNEIDDKSRIDEFIGKIYYTPINYSEVTTYQNLAKRLTELRTKDNISGNTIFYLATPPGLYAVIPKNLALADLNKQADGWKRLIIEKPFGYDLESALKLNSELLKDWEEEQIFRIDHYLGKETVQNLLVTRFSNGIFEPLWNRNFIHHIEITSAENIGVERRGGYYETTGALRDMVQNHLLQIVGLTAMEPVSSLEPAAIRNEILKVFQSLRPIKKEEVGDISIRGQYVSSIVKGESVPGYREEEGVSSRSVTETYAAIKFYIDNWRWGGVPFYIRTGKRLPTRITEVAIHFKPTPHFLFSQNKNCQSCNQLIIRIQPDEGIVLKIGIKLPGEGFEVQDVNMSFHYSELTNQPIPSAYERLLHDSIRGDSTLFTRTEEVMESWRFLNPILDAWGTDKKIPLFGYPAGTWGPNNADTLIGEKGMTWRYPCKNLSNDGIYCEL